MFNQTNTPVLDAVTARMLKELPNEGAVNLMFVFRATLMLEY